MLARSPSRSPSLFDSAACSMGRELTAPRTDRTTRIPSGVTSPVTTNHAAKGSVFVDLRNAATSKIGPRRGRRSRPCLTAPPDPAGVLQGERLCFSGCASGTAFRDSVCASASVLQGQRSGTASVLQGQRSWTAFVLQGERLCFSVCASGTAFRDSLVASRWGIEGLYRAI